MCPDPGDAASAAAGGGVRRDRARRRRPARRGSRPSISETEQWTLPGGGIDFGEHPDDAVVREVHEETGLDCELGRPIWIGSAHRVFDRRSGDPRPTEMHSVRIVYDAWVAADAPEPRVVEVDGSTVDARWHPLADVESRRWSRPCRWCREALGAPPPGRRCSGWRRTPWCCATTPCCSPATRSAGPRPGTLDPAGRRRRPRRVVRRPPSRVRCGGDRPRRRRSATLLGVHDEHFTGTAPHGREEDFHGIAPGVRGRRSAAGDPAVQEPDGTTDAVAWVRAGRRGLRSRPGVRGRHRRAGDVAPASYRFAAHEPRDRSSPTAHPA